MLSVLPLCQHFYFLFHWHSGNGECDMLMFFICESKIYLSCFVMFSSTCDTFNWDDQSSRCNSKSVIWIMTFLRHGDIRLFFTRRYRTKLKASRYSINRYRLEHYNKVYSRVWVEFYKKVEKSIVHTARIKKFRSTHWVIFWNELWNCLSKCAIKYNPDTPWFK